MKSQFAKNITAYRKANNLSQHSMAGLLGIKRSAYAAYEEQRSSPSMDGLINICKRLDLNAHSLLFEDMDQS